MNIITENSLADIEFQLKWKSNDADHTEKFFTKVNLWRDILPPGLDEQLLGKTTGDVVQASYGKDANLLPASPSNRKTVKRNQFVSKTNTPRYGRFYPLGKLSGIANVFPENMKPFRVTGVENGSLNINLNHPLSGYDLAVKAVVHEAITKPYDRGGGCSMLIECLADGPGMQIRSNGRSTDFFSDNAFDRENETDDGLFYRKPRFVNHIDEKAIGTIAGLYGSLIHPGSDVLDLMSAWRSHVPDTADLKSLVGLGMNADEMADNPQLTDFRVHDLNAYPKLPFEDNSFDIVIGTVSVEYLIHPDEVFADVARVLRPGGTFVLTFSNRWFPPKVIRIWPELHEFERMGLVLEYFLRTGKFNALNTFSSRGWPRPETDKYYPEMFTSDPVYAVWGRTMN